MDTQKENATQNATEVIANKQSTICPGCEASNALDDTTCQVCGTKLVTVTSDLPDDKIEDKPNDEQVHNGATKVGKIVGGAIIAAGIVYTLWKSSKAAPSTSNPSIEPTNPAIPEAPIKPVLSSVSAAPTASAVSKPRPVVSPASIPVTEHWETCEITYVRYNRTTSTYTNTIYVYNTPYYFPQGGASYPVIQFVAVLKRPGDPEIVWKAMDRLDKTPSSTTPPDETAELRSDLDAMTREMLRHKWQAVGHGSHWFSYQFRRLITNT